MHNSKEFVGSGGHVKVTGFFVGEKRVGNPNVFQVLGAHHDPFDAWKSTEREPRIFPVLSEVEIRCEILRNLK